MEVAATYQARRIKAEDATIRRALRILANRLREPGAVLGGSGAVRDYLALWLGEREHETFGAIFLDAQNRVLAAEELFRGTLTHTSIYPRELVKRALAWNAAGVVLAHNHPSGNAEPSHADGLLTETLRNTLASVDVETLDHFIVAGHRAVSFAEHGWHPFGPLAMPASGAATKAKRGRPRKAKPETQAAGE